MKRTLGFWLLVAACGFYANCFGANFTLSEEGKRSYSGERIEASHNGSESDTYTIRVPTGKKATVKLYIQSATSGNISSRYLYVNWNGGGESSLSGQGSSASRSFTSDATVTIGARCSPGTYEEAHIGYYYTSYGQMPYLYYTTRYYSAYYFTVIYDIEVSYESLLPDLTISDLQISPTQLASDETATLLYVIKNVGSVAAEASVACVYDGNEIIGNLEIDGIPAGKSTSGSFDVPRLTEGDHSIKIVADARACLTELDELNNSKATSISVYRRIPYTITFNANGGGKNSSAAIIGGNKIGTLPVLARPGYSFDGWWTDADGGSQISEDVLVVADVTYYAHWIASDDYMRYMIIDLAGGADANSYPVTYVDAPPEGGFNTSEYKTSKLVMRRIPAGTFIMGSDVQTVDNFHTATLPHTVKLSTPFYIGIFEITQKQWQLVMGTDPSIYGGNARPVENVSYDMIRGSSNGKQWPLSSAVDESSFMGKLRAKTGVNGFDLPTSAQWEYACRAGTTTLYSYGGDVVSSLALKPYARFADNESDGRGGYSVGHTVVGSYLPNNWGLYDMHGNVWEWCLDWRAERSSFTQSPVTDPAGPSTGTKRDYRGGGWQASAGHAATAYRASAEPSAKGNHTGFRICCVAEPIVYITFDANGGTVSPEWRSVVVGSSVGELPTPLRTGYVFAGWYTEESGGIKISTTTIVNADITYYALWTADKYKVTLDDQGATAAGTTSVKATYAKAMPAITVPVRAGYTFGGYFDSKDGTGTKYYYSSGKGAAKWDKAKAATLYAKWAANKYKVALNGNGATGDGTASVNAVYGADMPKITKPTRTGYIFAGYFANKDGSGDKYYNADGTSAKVWDVDSAVTLYARWVSASTKFKVTLNGQGATTAGTASVKVAFDNALPQIEVPTKTGYAFGGYFDEPNGKGTKYYYSSGKGAKKWDKVENTTLYAKWTPIKYTITFNRQGATVKGTDSVTATYGVALPQIEVPTKIGYVFGGYFEEPNGKGVKYYYSSGRGAVKWDKLKGATLYARWTTAKYTVTLDNQGATTKGTTSVTAALGASLPQITVPAKTGYTFAGYFAEPNGKGTKYYYSSGKGAVKWDQTANATLYARWTKAKTVAKLAAKLGSTATTDEAADEPTFEIEEGVLLAVEPNGLTEIEVPDTVVEIGEAAFVGCTEVERVVLPETVEVIGEFAFFGCAALEELVLPSGELEVSDTAFLGCPGLADDDGAVTIDGIPFDARY